MKFSLAILLGVAGLVSAAPAGPQISGVIDTTDSGIVESWNALTRRQGKGKSGGGSGGLGALGGGGGGGSTKNELLEGSCKKVTLIFARASTEPGNMGTSMGAQTCTGLKKAYNNDVACQGVGNPGGKGYTAGLGDNASPKGTSEAAIKEATKMFETANTKCPQSLVVAGGYSQGTAVMLNTLGALPEPLKKKVLGVVLFGYTKNKQQNGGIKNFPKDKVMVLCSEGDGVCKGTLSVTAGHFSYMSDGSGPKSLAFLKGKIDAAMRGGGSSGGDDSSAPAAEAPASKKSKGKSSKASGKETANPPPKEEAPAPEPAAEAAPEEAPAERIIATDAAVLEVLKPLELLANEKIVAEMAAGQLPQM